MNQVNAKCRSTSKSEADTKEIARNDKVECQLIFRSVSHTM